MLEKKNNLKENIIEEKNEVNSSNIFDEFTEKSNISNINRKNKKNKDLFDYIYKINISLEIFLGFFFLIFIISLAYVYAQNTEDLKDSSIISPICSFFEGEIAKKENNITCSSISYLEGKYKQELSNLIELQTNDILNILDILYKVESFTKTKEIIFLENKSQNKLKVLSILEEFDNLKNKFHTIDKQKIQCENIEISSEYNTISMQCSAYSAGYERGFIGFDGKIDNYIIGTSISIASSFINFIEKESTKFSIVEKQKLFKTDLILGEKSDLTNKTVFTLKLKYN